MVKYLFLKMARVYARPVSLEAFRPWEFLWPVEAEMDSLPALRPIYHFFRTMQMRAIEPLPATRFNMEKAKKAAEILGQRLANMMTEKVPFKVREECDEWYEKMYFVGRGSG